MRKLLFVLLLGVMGLSCWATELEDRLMKIHGVRSVELLEKGVFQERYVVMIEQPVDHSNPKAGTFEQRVIVGHAGFDRPTVIVTEGYGAAYALSPKYREENSKQLNANQVFVEHRYFGKSTPSPRDWQYMTGQNAAADLHAVRLAFADIYNHKWLATGISKGGQNSMIYRAYYPDDVDVTVAYVGPVCFGVEDGRHEPFLEKVGTAEQRNAILEFQKEVLGRRAALVPMMEEYVKGKDLKFRVPLDEVFDYCVLEYPFSIWQWGTALSLIPDAEATHDEIFDHLVTVAGPEYFAISDEPSFFVQAAAELGYYGYDIRPLGGLLGVKSAKNYLERIFLPEDARKIRFSDRIARKITTFLKQNDPKMVFVYGEYDPWSAVAPAVELFEGKQNMVMVVEPGGSHRARINTLPEVVRDKTWAQIEGWML